MEKFIKKYCLVILLGVVLGGAILRFYGIGSNPASLTWDEVSWGYNAYALGIDARDEFGVFLPYKFLESFGDFKPPMYAYLDILPVMVFGLTEFAVRFPSALFGTLTVLLTYFLTRRIFSTSANRELFALLAAFFLAISPWHINLSRAAFEANVAQFFIVLGVWLFLEAVHQRRWLLVLSAVAFVASFYTFNTARIVVPFLVLILAIAHIKVLWAHKKQSIISAMVGVLLVLPIVPFLISPQANLRFREVNIFSDLSVITRTNQEIANDNHAAWSRVIHHRYLTFSAEYVKHYLDHFNPEFLFIRGDGNPKFSTQQVGQLYLWEMGFFVGGILLLIRRREGKWWLVPLWMLIGIIPAATARETPHALRIETTLPTFQIITAYGVGMGIIWIAQIRNQIARIVGVSFAVILLLINVLYYLHGYYMHYPREYSTEWQYGYKESILYTQEVSNEYDQFVVSDTLGRPYNYYTFYLKTDPKEFRTSAKVSRDVFGFVTVSEFGKYRFVRDMPNDVPANTLLIAPPYMVPEQSTRVKEFKALNGDVVFVAYTLNRELIVEE